MSRQSLNLPINIPWCQIAVTEQMIDTNFGDRRFPAPWRSSIAISAYEPEAEDLPEEFGEKRITYLKFTCSITGYQPTRDETDRGYADLDDGSTSFRLILEEYLACYGVMLNIAVFPATTRQRGPGTEIQVGDDDLANYPHIIAIEPKNRDLYQAATESGEVLTASNSKFSTDKTLTQTESTEKGFEVEVPLIDPNSGQKIGGIKSSRTRTDADQESWSVQTDASRDRRETQGTTTQLSQMYNLLTGYHQGTNRATFLMLPRPHTLQATDRRTFIQGLRVIEGIQEFMLVVERPSNINTLCVEAFLETGHFPEDPEFTTPNQQFDENDEELELAPITTSYSYNPFNFGRTTKKFDESITVQKIGKNGYELDVEKGIGGISETILEDDNASGTTGSGGVFGVDKKPRLEEYTFAIQEPNKLVVSGMIRSVVRGTTTFHRKYTIHLRRPITEPSEPHTTVTDLLITQRGLEVCIKSGEGCPKVVKDTRPATNEPGTNKPIAMYRESIVDERKIRINPGLLTRQAINQSSQPATKELLRQIQNAMTTSGRLPSRYPAGKVSYLESDYFKNQVAKILPKEKLEKYLTGIKGLPDMVIKTLGEKCTVAEALELDLSDFARKTGLSIEDSTKARRSLLGLEIEREDDVLSKSNHSHGQ